MPADAPGRTEYFVRGRRGARASLGKKLLEGLGYQVTMQTSALAAIGLARAAPALFDLGATDFTMPGMAGVKFGSELQPIWPGLPVFLTTGCSSVLTTGKARSLASRDF